MHCPPTQWICRRLPSVVRRRVLPLLAPLTALAVASPSPAVGQAPKVFYACYVPSSGTVYRIKETNTPDECGSTAKKGSQSQPHIEFSWTDGAGADHGALTGLADDDHLQYVLANGLRNSVNGFAVGGTWGVGAIPASGPGARMMWYPRKAAFRAGRVEGAYWDDINIGHGSAAFGINSTASGDYSFATGVGQATGFGATALGTNAWATGTYSVAIGNFARASGPSSFAFGYNANTNSKEGAIVFSDNSAATDLNAAADNQFVVRAARFWLGTNNGVTAGPGRFIETSTGAYLSSGGAWTNSSDSTRKTAFRDIDGDSVLAQLAAMRIRTWAYNDEDSTVRHLGPTAQDFRAAFSLGDSETAIATVDADGVALAAIQALTRANAALRSQIAALEERLTTLEAALGQPPLRSSSSTNQR